MEQPLPQTQNGLSRSLYKARQVPVVAAIYTQLALFFSPWGLITLTPLKAGVLKTRSEYRARNSQTCQGTLQSVFSSTMRIRGCLAGNHAAESSLLDCPVNIWTGPFCSLALSQA